MGCRGTLAICAALAGCGGAASASVVDPSARPPVEQAIDLTLPRYGDPDPVALRSYLGKVLVVDVWATWCAPCRQALPALEALQTQYADDAVVVLTLNVDDTPDDIATFVAQTGIGLPVLRDTPDGHARRVLGVREIPTTVVLDRHGRVRFVHAGYRPGQVARLRAQVTALIEESS